MSDSKSKILDRIKKAKSNTKLWEGVDKPSTENFFQSSDLSMIGLFKSKLDELTANLLVVNSSTELHQALRSIFDSQSVSCFDVNLQSILNEADLNYVDSFDKKYTGFAFISCEYAVARLGSIITSSALASGRQLNVIPEHQVILVEKKQLIYNIEDAFEDLPNRYENLPSFISIATGPSRTADIEKTLILGAHGPKRMTVIYKNFED
ncbi:MAG: LUD domain-containing protein [Bacteroidales bacterium]|nr:LUD domain-containing protein [Bacteroidales bacterium]